MPLCQAGFLSGKLDTYHTTTIVEQEVEFGCMKKSCRRTSVSRADKSALGAINRPLQPIYSPRLIDYLQTIHTP
jgi:hypothetical protein